MSAGFDGRSDDCRGPCRSSYLSLPAVGAAFAVAPHLAFDVSRASAQQIDPLQGHFYLKGKAPSKFTLDVLNQAKATLPFADQVRFRAQPLSGRVRLQNPEHHRCHYEDSAARLEAFN